MKLSIILRIEVCVSGVTESCTYYAIDFMINLYLPITKVYMIQITRHPYSCCKAEIRFCEQSTNLPIFQNPKICLNVFGWVSNFCLHATCSIDCKGGLAKEELCWFFRGSQRKIKIRFFSVEFLERFYNVGNVKLSRSQL